MQRDVLTGYLTKVNFFFSLNNLDEGEFLEAYKPIIKKLNINPELLMVKNLDTFVEEISD